VKIALIVPGGVDRSGTHRIIPFLIYFIERLARRHEVHVFAMRQEPRPARWTLLGAQVHNIGARPRRLRAVAAILAEHRRAPFDVLHAAWAVPQGVVGAMAKRLTGRPLVLWAVNGEFVSLPEIGYGGQRNARGRFWVRWSVAAADRTVVPAQCGFEQSALLGFTTEIVVPALALDVWPPRPPRRRDPREPARLLHIGDLNLVKDQETLLRAAAHLAAHGLDFTLDVAGADTLGGRVQTLAAELGLRDRVRFHGSVARPELYELAARSHLLIVSSRADAAPFVVLEAAAVGVPTVGTAVGQVTDWAPDAAIAVPVGDAVALAAAIRRLVTDEDARMTLAEEAHRRAVARDATDMAGDFERIYRELTGSA
jgi:glycosyltransferase involved in cell wall biosynthesis